MVINMNLSVCLPNWLKIKSYVLVQRAKHYGRLKPYAMGTDKNGYPHFLFCLDGNWIWLSAKYFTL